MQPILIDLDHSAIVEVEASSAYAIFGRSRVFIDIRSAPDERTSRSTNATPKSAQQQKWSASPLSPSGRAKSSRAAAGTIPGLHD
jgi:hypothetical protein